MDEHLITCQIEKYFNNVQNDCEFNIVDAQTAQDKYKLRTAQRLINAHKLYKQNGKYYGDFLLSLRDYLLVFNTSLKATNIEILKENDFAINRDESEGKYFASYQFPEYVDSNFVKLAFLNEFYVEQKAKNGYELLTDPLIYSITGFSRFKTMSQKLAVYGALNTPDGYTTLVSLPTGGGKSLITQTIAYQKEGLTVVIVPTISLALDQVRVAKDIIHSEHVDEEIFYYSGGVDSEPILKNIKNKKARLLFISPEALIKNPGFVDAIGTANKQRYLKNVIIDEAHIVVDWGASFRIDYQCLESWRKNLLLKNPNLRTILLSATYERRCIDILKDFFSKDEKWIEIRCDELRHEPRYILVESKTLSQKRKRVLELVKKLPHPMIIYVSQPFEAEKLKEYLEKKGINNTRTFTGATTSSMREALIKDWIDDKFEIMIATSAFGVGVDKSDVRTVLHVYVPQNPNAYYQELGRGGRDKLPCLSVMCICSTEDLNITRNRINKKVLTTEKILGRWDSMYNSPKSIRVDDYINIDTTIKPKYSISDEFEDTIGSEADINWNIYVLLLLRRYKLININEVRPQNGNYVFVVTIEDDKLRNIDEKLRQQIDWIRTQESRYYLESFKLINEVILQNGKKCWSEMFYETYDKVSEYCAGCSAHLNVKDSDFYEFPLKKQVTQPIKHLVEEQLALFGVAKEMVIVANDKQKPDLLNALQEKRLSVLITNDSIDLEALSRTAVIKRNLLIINSSELRDLMSKNCFYYISGLVAIFYSEQEDMMYKQLRLVRQYLSSHVFIRTIHIIPENIYFGSINKVFTDLIDGPVIPLKAIC